MNTQICCFLWDPWVLWHQKNSTEWHSPSVFEEINYIYGKQRHIWAFRPLWFSVFKVKEFLCNRPAPAPCWHSPVRETETWRGGCPRFSSASIFFLERLFCSQRGRVRGDAQRVEGVQKAVCWKRYSFCQCVGFYWAASMCHSLSENIWRKWFMVLAFMNHLF